MLAEVEAAFLLRLGDPEPDEIVDQPEDAQRHDERKSPGDRYANQLFPEQGGRAIEEPVRSGGIESQAGEKARGDHSPGAADAVAGPHVQCVVNTPPAGTEPSSQKAEYTCSEANQERGHGTNEACGRRHGGEPDNCP